MIEDIAPIHTVAYTQRIMSTVVIYVKQTSKLVFSHNTERHHFLFPVKNEQNQRKRLGKIRSTVLFAFPVLPSSCAS